MRNLLREKRLELYPNISMKEFCEKIGIKKGSYWNWENGLSTSYAEHNAWTARRVCEALGISDAELKEALSNNYKAAKDGTMEKSNVYICAPNKKNGVSNVLTDWRINNRLTTKDAADVLEVSQRVYCLWENGKCKPSGDNLKKLLALTGLSVSQLATIYTDTHSEKEEELKIVEIEDPHGNVYEDVLEPDPDEPEVIASPITPEEFAALNDKEVEKVMDDYLNDGEVTERDEDGTPIAGRYPMTEDDKHKKYHNRVTDIWVEKTLEKIQSSPLAHPKDPDDPFADFDLFAYDNSEKVIPEKEAKTNNGKKPSKSYISYGEYESGEKPVKEPLNEPHDFRDEVIDEVLEKMYGQMDYKKYVYLIGLLGR